MRRLILLFTMVAFIFGLASCVGEGNVSITFNSMGGTEVEDLVVTVNQTSINLPEPTREGYTFDGWYLDEALTQPFTIAALLTSQSLTLYAKWDALVDTYTITFNSNGGSAVTAITAAEGATVTAPTAPTRSGYTFAGWYSDAALTTAYTFSTMPAENITLYAKWNVLVTSSTISFESNGGTAVSAITQEEGSAVTAPTAPTKVGYAFAGWFSDAGLTTSYTFSTMPVDDLTLYAKWTVNQYTITFESNGGSAVAALVQDFGTAVTAPVAPTKLGHTFAGWYSDVGLTTAYTFSTMPAANTTLYAKWTINQYTITFESNGGSAVAAIVQNFGTAVVAPATPTRTGYTFAGWYSDAGLTTAYTFSTMPAANTTLYAKWTINQYTITFESNGGSAVAAIVQNFGTAVVAPATPTKDDYEFAGWFSDPELTTAYVFTTMPSQNITVYAKWAEIYTLEFEYGENDIPDAHYIAGETIVLPADPTREGFDFVGWYADEFLLVPFDALVMPGEDTTLYGKWIRLTYTASFETSGGTVIPDQAVFYGDEIMMPSIPEREGFLFVGWYTDLTLTTLFDFGMMPAMDVTIYAGWVPDEGFDYISSILVTNPAQVHVRGVVYYKYPNPMNPGFYLYDGTGYIFVMAPADTINVGDAIEFDADFGYFEDTPQLTNPTNIQTQTDFEVMPDYMPMDLGVLAEAEPDQHIYNAMPLTLTGFVMGMDMGNYLLGNMGNRPVLINYKSIQGIMPDPFVSRLGQQVTIDVVVIGYSPMQNLWHVNYVDESLVDVPLTDQEKVDMLIAFGTNELDGKTFYPGQVLELPETDDLFGATLLFVTSGPNAGLFDVTTGVFGDTEVRVPITLDITVTLNSASASTSVTMYLEPIVTLTIAEFKALPEMAYGMVEGVVLLSLPDGPGIMIIADETGILVVMNDSMVAYGDRVLVEGMHTMMEGISMMANEFGANLIDIIAHDQPIPILPTLVTLEQFELFDAEDPVYWARYIALTGMVVWDQESHMLMLSNGSFNVPIMAMNPEVYMTLDQLEGFMVTLTGITLPNFDEDIPFLMFVFVGLSDDIQLYGTDLEIATHVSMLLEMMFEEPVYFPGQTIEFVTEHPFLPLSASYETASLLIDLGTGVISETIESETTIVITATVTYGTATVTVDLDLLVRPIEILSITNFKTMATETSMFTSGVVLFRIPQSEYPVYLIADEGDILFVGTMTPLNTGDLIIINGVFGYQEGMPFIWPEMHDAVVSVVSNNNPNPLVATPITHEAFLALDTSDPNNNFDFYQLTGTLTVFEHAKDIFMIIDEFDRTVMIFVPEEETQFMLAAYDGFDVRISGLSQVDSESSNIFLVYLGLGDDIELTMTDLEIFNLIEADMTDEYALATFRQGVYHKLPQNWGDYITFGYVVTDPMLYDLTTHQISSAIAVETYVEITVTLTVGSITDTFVINLHVVPIVTTTIYEFINGVVGAQYQVRGVVLFSAFSHDGGVLLIADHTGRLSIIQELFLEVGQEVIIEGYLGEFMGLPTFDDTYPITVVEVLSEYAPNPLAFTPYDVADLNAVDIGNVGNWGMPITLSGYVQMDPYGNPYLTELPDGGLRVDVMAADYEAYWVMQQLVYFRAQMRGYLYPMMEDPMNPGYILMLDPHYPIMPDYDTESEIIAALIDVGTMMLESEPFQSRGYIELPHDMEIFGAYFEWQVQSGPIDLIDFETGYIGDVMGPTIITLRAIVTIGMVTEVHDFTITIEPFIVLNIPDLSTTMVPGQFGGLYIHKIDYANDGMGGTEFVVELRFPRHDGYGVDYFYLEYFDTTTETWETYLYNEQPLTTLYYDEYYEEFHVLDNFSLTLPVNTLYRLKAQGGPGPLVSNTVYVEGTVIETRFNEWGLDESVYLTGVMSPDYGYGLEVNVFVVDALTWSDIEDYETYLSYQWYRVNPHTFDMTAIPGANQPMYQSTFEDVGHYLLVKVSGDEIHVGGYIQILSWNTVKVANPAKVISFTPTSFIVEFSHNFNFNDLYALRAYNELWEEIPIINFSPVGPNRFEFFTAVPMSGQVNLELWVHSWYMMAPTPYGHWDTVGFYV